jgi:hypothetical protein
MMKLVMSTKPIKNVKQPIPIHKSPMKKNNVPIKLMHPVNSVLLDVVTKKQLKSCGCGR